MEIHPSISLHCHCQHWGSSHCHLSWGRYQPPPNYSLDCHSSPPPPIYFPHRSQTFFLKHGLYYSMHLLKTFIWLPIVFIMISRFLPWCPGHAPWAPCPPLHLTQGPTSFCSARCTLTGSSEPASFDHALEPLPHCSLFPLLFVWLTLSSPSFSINMTYSERPSLITYL